MKAICLTLPESADKTEAARKHFSEAGLDDVEFVWGIHAHKAGLATVHPYEVDNPGSGFRMGYKPTGIWLGHWIIWTIMNRAPDDHFMVLETDAKFQPGWKEKFGQAMADVPPDFDFLHIGHCCMEGHPRTHIKGDVYETKHSQCTHAYVMNRKCIPFLLRTLRKVWSPIDIQMIFECFPHLRTFAVMPRIVDQFDTLLSP